MGEEIDSHEISCIEKKSLTDFADYDASRK